MNAIAWKWPRLDWSYDNAEALKWLAFASMLLDHASKLFGPWDWAVPVGRVAFPVFAFLIGRHLVSDRLLQRLVFVGAVATLPAWMTINGGQLLPLNILWTFAFSAGVVRLLGNGRYELAGVLFLLAVVVCDYSLPGVLLVISAWAWWRERSTATVVMLAASLAMLCLFNGNPFALLAVPLVLLAAVCDWRVPRIRWFFWIGYPVHLVVLYVLAAPWGVGA